MTGYYSSTKYSTIHVHAYTTSSHTHTRVHKQSLFLSFFFPFVIFCSYIDVIFLSISACSMNLSTSSSVTGFSSHCTSLKDNTTSNSHISLHVSCIFRGSAVMVISMGKLHVAAEFLQANWMVKPAAILLPEAFHARFLLHVRAGWGLQHAFGGGDTVDLGTRWVDVGGDHGPGHYGLLPLGWSLCPAECGRLGGALAPKKRTPLGCFMRGYYEKVSDYQLVIVEMVGWLIDCDVFECWNLIDWLVGNGAAGENHRLLNQLQGFPFPRRFSLDEVRRASTLELNRFDQGIHCLRGAAFLEKSGNLPTNQPPNDEFHAKAALIYACEPIWGAVFAYLWRGAWCLQSFGGL